MNNDYKNTLNLPKTSFSMKGNLIYKELDILNKWKKNNIYLKIRKSKNKKKIFFLHDGPPYANGNIHIGHAVNKILKDIIIKFKGLSGFNAPFIIGWDCHGLPIELKINEICKKDKKEISIKEFYKICRKYVLNQIKIQKEDFIRLGILGDWNNSYSTMNYETESNIINVLEKLFNLGFLKRDNKPVYWCIKCESSISELETKHYNYLCKSIYIMYKIFKIDNIINLFNINIKNNNIYSIFFISWTTTPWTIIDSQAVSINSNIYYSLIKINNNYYIISENSVLKIIKKFKNINYEILNKIKGKYLLNTICIHPITKNKISIINNKLIESNIGTGIVNIAPGHGLIDYEIGIKNKLKIINFIDKKGFYKNNLLENNSFFVFECIDIIKNILIKENRLFLYEEFNHKYPHCYRHKYPIIFRSTYQWFINLNHNDLRNKAINYSQKVNWIPKWGKEKIKNMLINRSDWCISRQRKWGVPITFFINKNTNLIHPKSNIFFKKIIKLVKKNGIEAWNNLNINKFLKKNELNNYIKSQDILDVWFDSGTTLLSTIFCKKKYKNIKQSDLYLEGYDQYRGWFMSSLLIFVAINNISPYKNVITHGFVLDDINKKMSKSIGNVINIKDLLKKYGSDIIRLWIAYTNYTKDIKISDETFNRISDIYRKIRNTIRFLLSNLYDFNIKEDKIKFNKLIKIDQWIINKLYYIQKNIINSYNNYNFHNVIKDLLKFCSIDLGSIYLEIIKDRQYTLNKNSFSRKSCQTAMYHIIESISRLISPILSFTSEEIWNYIPGKRSISIFTQEWYKLKKFNKNEIFNEKYWKLIFNIKNEINLLLEKEINEKNIKNSLETKIILYLNDELFNKLLLINDELKYILIVSSVKIININDNLYENNDLKYKKTKINGLKIEIIKFTFNNKCNRCWNYYERKEIYINNEYICTRCILNINGFGKERKYA